MENSKVLRRNDVVALTRLSYSTIYRLERSGRFPPRRKLSVHTVGWLREEVELWIASRSPHPRAEVNSKEVTHGAG